MLSCIVGNLMVTRKTTDKNEKDCISGSAVSVLILFERMSTVSPTALETYRAKSVDTPLNLPYKAFARITFFLQHTRMNLLVMNYFFAILTIYLLCFACTVHVSGPPTIHGYLCALLYCPRHTAVWPPALLCRVK